MAIKTKWDEVCLRCGAQYHHAPYELDPCLDSSNSIGVCEKCCDDWDKTVRAMFEAWKRVRVQSEER